jgi:hypothetical protein
VGVLCLCVRRSPFCVTESDCRLCDSLPGTQAGFRIKMNIFDFPANIIDKSVLNNEVKIIIKRSYFRRFWKRFLLSVCLSAIRGAGL